MSILKNCEGCEVLPLANADLLVMKQFAGLAWKSWMNPGSTKSTDMTWPEGAAHDVSNVEVVAILPKENTNRSVEHLDLRDQVGEPMWRSNA